MRIDWRAAHPSLHPYLRGFVERADAGAGAGVMLPFGIPVIHIELANGDAPRAALCTGIEQALATNARDATRTFVIALGFSGVGLLSGVDASAARGRFVALTDAPWTRLARQLGEAPDFASRVALVEHPLGQRVLAARATASVAHRAADLIAHDRWLGTVRDLADAFGVEERTLRNRFGRELGCSPKRLLKVARFNRALRALHPHSWAGSPAADARLEFFDDAHFHRDFIAHAGLSPAAFVAAKRRSRDPTLHTVALDPMQMIAGPSAFEPG